MSYAPDTSVLDVVWGVIEAELRERGSLAFLGDACGVDGRGGDGGGGVTPGEEFPSWMPLWYGAASHVRTTAETFGALEVEGLVRYAAGGQRRDAAWVGMNRARQELNVGGLLVGKVGMLGEVYDRDAEESEVLRVRRGWAPVCWGWRRRKSWHRYWRL